MKKISACLALVTLAGCATPPERIAAVANPGPCSPQDRERLGILSNKQSKAATGDAMGVFLFGVPMASMAGGDNEAEIAILKGRCTPNNTGRATARAKSRT